MSFESIVGASFWILALSCYLGGCTLQIGAMEFKHVGVWTSGTPAQDPKGGG